MISSLWYVCCMYTLYTKRLLILDISSLWYVCCMCTLYIKRFPYSWLVLCNMYVVCIHCILSVFLILDYYFDMYVVCVLYETILITSLWYACCMYTLYTKLFSDSWLVFCDRYVVCIHCILNDLLFLISTLSYICCMYTLYTKLIFWFLISSLWQVCCMYTLYTKRLLILH